MRPIPRRLSILLGLAIIFTTAARAQTANPFDGQPWRGKIDIQPRRYVLKAPVVLGAKVNPSDDKLEPATVTTTQATEIEKGDILIDEGLWTATGTRFAQTKLRIDLGGALVASDSLFEDCEMSKGGVWFVDWHSSKWTFNNCAFTKRFISPLQINDIGIKATHCTFYEVDLALFRYKQDAAKELQNEWMQIENCRFVKCSVPESFLLLTKDCVFDACTFGKAEPDIPGATPITVKVNLINANSSKPKAGKTRAIQITEADLPASGATALRFRRTGKTLRFE